MNTETWRVIDESGATLGTPVTRVDDSRGCVFEVRYDMYAVRATTPRVAALRFAAERSWSVVEILAPGERSRADLLTEIASLKAQLAAAQPVLQWEAIRSGRTIGLPICAGCNQPRVEWCDNCGGCANECCTCDETPYNAEAPHG